MKNMALTFGAALAALVISATLEARAGSVLVTISSNATSAQQQWLEESLGQFADNGLELPDIEVSFFDDESECGGHEGTYRRNTEPAQIRICSAKPFVLPHELAHAWEAAQVTDETRASYMAQRDLETWSDHGYDWNKRGVEDAAFIVQQNLTKKNVRTESSTWQERIAAYELLTGLESPLRTS